MATVSVINTTSLAIFIGEVKVAHATSGTLTLTHSPRDITSKDSGGWRDLLEGLRSWSMSVGGLYAMDAALGADDLLDEAIARTTVTVRFTTDVTGDKVYSGTAYVASCNLNSDGSEGNAAYDSSLEGKGILAVGTVSA